MDKGELLVILKMLNIEYKIIDISLQIESIYIIIFNIALKDFIIELLEHENIEYEYINRSKINYYDFCVCIKL